MLIGIKRSLGWGNFYDKYDEKENLRKKILYQPPEEKNDALEFNEHLDMIDLQMNRNASNDAPKMDASKRKGFFKLQGRAGSMLPSSAIDIRSKVRLHNS